MFAQKQVCLQFEVSGSMSLRKTLWKPWGKFLTIRNWSLNWITNQSKNQGKKNECEVDLVWSNKCEVICKFYINRYLIVKKINVFIIILNLHQKDQLHLHTSILLPCSFNSHTSCSCIDDEYLHTFCSTQFLWSNYRIPSHCPITLIN